MPIISISDDFVQYDSNKYAKWAETDNILSQSDSFKYYKKLSERLILILIELGLENKALNIKYCGTQLLFESCAQDNYKRLKSGNFCKQRLCLMCEWRKSLKNEILVSEVCHIASDTYPLHWIFLTLTVKNVYDCDLSKALDEMFESWTRITQRKQFRKAVKGWFRVLQVTRNHKMGTMHPHFHVLLAVKKSYFTGRYYISHDGWFRLWSESLRVLDVDPVGVHVKRAYIGIGQVADTSIEIKQAVKEIAHYTTRTDNLLPLNDEYARKIVGILATCLRGRRLLAYGGILKTIWKEVKDMKKVSDEKEECKCEICGGELKEQLFKWDFGIGEYIEIITGD